MEVLKSMDDKGQMMILEVIFFTAIVVLSLVFIYQISPSSIVTNKYANDLKIAGDGALYSLYDDIIVEGQPSNYRFSKMEHYLITNAYGDFISDLNNMLPPNVMYNIYISNGTTTKFWCSFIGDYYNSMISIDPVSVSHCFVAIDPYLLTGFPDSHYIDGKYGSKSDLSTEFLGYSGSAYSVILEMWYI